MRGGYFRGALGTARVLFARAVHGSLSRVRDTHRSMDLTKTPPRSPYEALGDIVFLPRAIDKMRAHLAGTKGDYNSHAGTSERMLRVLFGITPEEFEAIVRDRSGARGGQDEGDQAVLDE